MKCLRFLTIFSGVISILITFIPIDISTKAVVLNYTLGAALLFAACWIGSVLFNTLNIKKRRYH